MSGTIPLGSKITNRELQERFQVSSTPVRDTINKLYQDGLVKEVTKTGAQVINFDYGYAEEINEFIASISCVALNMTIAKGTDKEVTKYLKEYLKKSSQLLRMTMPTLMQTSIFIRHSLTSAATSS